MTFMEISTDEHLPKKASYGINKNFENNEIELALKIVRNFV